MSKYNALWTYIKENDSRLLSFDDIESVCGFPIDHSFLNAKRELETYGYKIRKISLKEKTKKVEKV